MEAKFKLLCQQLINGKYPRDDTLFEKFISSVSKNETIVRVLASSPEFQDIIKNCHENLPSIEPTCLSGLLRIFAVVAEKNFNLFIISEHTKCAENILMNILVNCLQISSAIEDKGLKIAIIICLKYIFSSYEQFSENFHDVIWSFLKQCLQDSSIFVANRASSLYADLLLLCKAEYSKKEVGNCSDKCGEIIPQNSDCLLYKLFYCSLSSLLESSNLPQKIQALQIFISATGQCSFTDELKAVIEEVNLVPKLVEVLKKFNSNIAINHSLQIINNLSALGLLQKGDIELLLNIPFPRHLFSTRLKLYSTIMCFASIPSESIEEQIIDILKEILNEFNCRSNKKFLMQCLSVCGKVKYNSSHVVDIICKSTEKELMDDQKVVLACLNCLINLCKTENLSLESQEKILQFVCTLISTTSDPQVISKAYECVLILVRFKEVEYRENKISYLLEQLGNILPEKLMNIKWEIRDSTLEFVGNLADISNDWFLKYNYIYHIWNSLDDGESYVKAAALIALKRWLHNSVLQKLVLSQVTSLKISSKVIAIAKFDEEAFARRAAVDLISNVVMLSEFEQHKNELVSAILHCGKDLDWEVKITVLKFWEIFLRNLFSEDQCIERKSTCEKVTLLQEKLKVASSHSFEALMTLMDDCDTAVQDKCLSVIEILRFEMNKFDIKIEVLQDILSEQSNGQNHDKVQKFIDLLCSKQAITQVKEINYDVDLNSLLDDIVISVCTNDESYEEEEDNAAMLDCY